MKIRHSFFIIYLLSTFLGTVAAQDFNITVEPVEAAVSEKVVLPLSELPDSTVVRRSITNTHIVNSVEEAASQTPKLVTDTSGNSFIVSVKKTEAELAVRIVPALVLGENPQGSWIIVRDIADGAVTRVDVVLRAQEPLILSFRPPFGNAEAGRSYMDVRLFNTAVTKNYPIGLPFDTLLTAPMTKILDAAAGTEITRLTTVHGLYSTVAETAKITAEKIDRLVALDNACFDAEGNPVYIDTKQAQREAALSAALLEGQTRETVLGGVNGAGFAKWVIDGMVYSVAGQGIFIDSLKRPTDVPDTYFTKPYLQVRKPFFGIDWIRNLSAAALSLKLRRTVYPNNAGLDVSIEPFARAAAYNNPSAVFLGWQKNVGYQSEFLDALFYYVTVRDSELFYLGAVSRETGTPSLREYPDIYVFFPYFTAGGEFHIEVFNGIRRLTIDEFIKENRGAFTFLVRVCAPESGLYNPQ